MDDEELKIWREIDNSVARRSLAWTEHYLRLLSKYHDAKALGTDLPEIQI